MSSYFWYLLGYQQPIEIEPTPNQIEYRNALLRDIRQQKWQFKQSKPKFEPVKQKKKKNKNRHLIL